MCRGYFSSQEIDSHHATEHRSTDQSRNGCRMCCFCHAQRFEITRAKNKMHYLATFIQNAKVVEAFCHAACRLSNQCRPSIHQPPVDEFRVPAEMSIALSLGSPACAHARRLVLAPRPPSRSPPTYDPHGTRCTAGCHTSRDFVPWRFLDAGQLSLPSVSSLPASTNQHKSARSGMPARSRSNLISRPWTPHGDNLLGKEPLKTVLSQKKCNCLATPVWVKSIGGIGSGCSDPE
jgi:hypothetical protein